ncbi:ABC transporter substrate-binding protein [Martelella mediterranea]|uniref:Iron complex transport system substrate-binding protein n=1 Tax=Martelella mediterranea TaxID=293089 RepID=A0A4R3NTJ6_9HYPH|nr:ABC transporter substrate-binding protein [Martelella mediterranea]TCT40226.1 iron complex transport system substrate-binding protein [Martelella mediterranea]
MKRTARIKGSFLFLSGLMCASLALLPAAVGSAVAAMPPERVVSINLCTDQMAILLAKPGQLISVSMLASDPAVSALSEEAESYRPNYGLAEEVFMMKPDLVLAGSYTTRETVALLKRLGIKVAEFDPEPSLNAVRDNLLRMGELLGTSEKAEALVETMDRQLADIVADGASHRTVVLYYANGYTSGKHTLAGDIAVKAGLENIGAVSGVDGLGRLPLERLVLAAPDVIVSGGQEYEAPALAEEVFQHPAFRSLAENSTYVQLASSETICGGPFNLEAVQRLHDAAKKGVGDE